MTIILLFNAAFLAEPQRTTVWNFTSTELETLPIGGSKLPKNHDMLIPTQTSTQNSHSWSLKMTYSGVTEKPLRAYMQQHDCGLVYESTKEAPFSTNPRQPNIFCHFIYWTIDDAHLTPHPQRNPANIRINLILLETFKLLWWAPVRNTLCHFVCTAMPHSASGRSRSIHGQPMSLILVPVKNAYVTSC